MKNGLLAIIAIVAFLGAISYGATYYYYSPIVVIGVTGNGSTDDTAAIQAAIDTAEAGIRKNIVIPSTSGNICMVSALTVNSPGITIRGETKDVTIKSLDSATTYIFRLYAGDFTLENITLDGNMTNNNDVYIAGVGAIDLNLSGITVRNVKFQNIPFCGVYLTSYSSDVVYSDGLIENCTFDNLGHAACLVSVPQNFRFIHNNITRTGVGGITLAASDTDVPAYVDVIDNYINRTTAPDDVFRKDDADWFLICLEHDGHDIDISHNTCIGGQGYYDSIGTATYDKTKSYNISVTDNIIRNPVGHAIDICSNMICSGNQVYNGLGSAIAIEPIGTNNEIDNVLISNNTITNTQVRTIGAYTYATAFSFTSWTDSACTISNITLDGNTVIDNQTPETMVSGALFWDKVYTGSYDITYSNINLINNDFSDIVTRDKYITGFSAPTGTFPDSKKADIIICDIGGTHHGPYAPTVASEGMRWIKEATGIKCEYRYDGSAWQPVKLYSNTTLYVDSSGTNDVNHGTAVDANAYATLTYALSMIPKSLGEYSVTINMDDDTFTDTPSIDSFSGILGITVNGTLTSLLGDFTATASTQGTGATRGTVNNSAASWTPDAYISYLAYTPTGDATNSYRLVVDNDATKLTCIGTWATAAPTGGTASIKQWGTKIDGGHTRNNLLTIKNNTCPITINNLWLYDASGTALLMSNNTGTVSFYRSRFEHSSSSAGYVANLGFSYFVPFYDCYFYGYHSGIFYGGSVGNTYLTRCFLRSTSGYGSAINGSSLGSSFIVMAGTTIDAFAYGVFLQYKSYSRFETAAANGYVYITNCTTKGIIARNGTLIFDNNAQFSGNTGGDTDADSGTGSYIGAEN